ncbi:hypothetical protein pb186bvf_000763 [Paramecium bursaria]
MTQINKFERKQSKKYLERDFAEIQYTQWEINKIICIECEDSGKQLLYYCYEQLDKILEDNQKEPLKKKKQEVEKSGQRGLYCLKTQFQIKGERKVRLIGDGQENLENQNEDRKKNIIKALKSIYRQYTRIQIKFQFIIIYSYFTYSKYGKKIQQFKVFFIDILLNGSNSFKSRQTNFFKYYIMFYIQYYLNFYIHCMIEGCQQFLMITIILNLQEKFRIFNLIKLLISPYKLNCFLNLYSMILLFDVLLFNIDPLLAITFQQLVYLHLYSQIRPFDISSSLTIFVGRSYFGRTSQNTINLLQINIQKLLSFEKQNSNRAQKARRTLSNKKGKFHKFLQIKYNYIIKLLKKQLLLMNSNDIEMLKKEEPMNNIDKYQIMEETQTFNTQKFQDENSRKILVKLIYLANQGIYFSEWEVEQLFFRITKLFQSNNSRLRQMVYKTLKIIMPQNHSHIILQFVVKDLNSDNQWFRVQALKFIPFIQSEQHIQQMERFLHQVLITYTKALLDTNLLISSQALVLGIHIVNKFPIFVGKWLFEVIQRLDEPKQNIENHALILLHEIRKRNPAQFIKILIELTHKPLQQLTQLQLIKFVQENMSNLEHHQKNLLVEYVMQLGNNTDLMIFFQSAQLQLNVQEIENDKLEPIISCLYGQLSHFEKNLEKFSSLHLIEKLIRYPGRQNLLDDKIILYIKALAFLYHFSISQKSLLIQARLYGDSAAIQLKKLFEQINVIQWQAYFLDGLLELIIMYPCYGQLALNFLQLVNMEYENIILATVAINIVEKVVIDQQQEIKIHLDTFLDIMSSSLDLKQQFQVIKIVSKQLLNISINELENQKITQIYDFIKEKFGNDEFQFPNHQLITFLTQNIINQQYLNNQIIINYGEKYNPKQLNFSKEEKQ